MGNSPSAGGGLLGNGHHNYQVDIRGSSASLSISGTNAEEDNNGKIAESWGMTYWVAGMITCGFCLRKTSGNNKMILPHHDDEKLEIEISDRVRGSHECFTMIVERDEAGLLHDKDECHMNFCIATKLTNLTTNAYGVITKTICDIYGKGKRMGLMVREWKSKSKDERPYMGTVTHYCVNGDENGQEIGLSVAIKKIRVLDNGQIGFTADGPEQHPADALVYMFKQVLRTGTWKRTHCPHCASKYIDERLSDSESDIDNVPPPRLYGRTQNAGSRSIVSNPGRFKGKNIGNTYINHYHRRK